MEREALADAAGVHVNTIRKMEVKGAAEITSGADTARWVQDAPESAGVELLVHGRPGVRLRKHPGGQQSRKKGLSRLVRNGSRYYFVLLRFAGLTR